MFHKVNSKNYTQYHDTFLISLILSIITIPFLWFLSQGNVVWVLSCTILWMTGVFAIYHLFIRHIFPMMLTKLGTFLLSSILAVITIWFNITLIFNLLEFDDIEIIFNQSLFDISFESLILFAWFYILIAGTLLSNLELRLNMITNRHKKLLQTLSSTPLFSYKLLMYYSEVILVFILPIALLFWTEITYSSRILLGIVSVGIGLSIFLKRIENEDHLQKVLISVISLAFIVIINSSVINLFGIEKIPDTTLKARISGEDILQNVQAYSIKNPSFQLSSNQSGSATSIYKILLSIPQLGLYLGHRIASISNEEIQIKSESNCYTIYDQFNKTLLKIKREKD